MKKINIIIFLMIACLTLSCKKEPEISISDREAIDFKTELETKSYISDTESLKQNCLLTSEKTSNCIHIYAKKTDESDHSTFIMQNRELKFDIDKWTYGDPVYWGLMCKHDFLAVFQDDNGAHTFENDTYVISGVKAQVNETDSNNNIQNDVLYARNSIEYSITQPAPVVVLSMQHALSAFTVNIKNISSKEIKSISNIRIEGLHTEAAKLNIPLNRQTTWNQVNLNLNDTKSNFVFKDRTQGLPAHSTNPVKLFGPCIILPQDFTYNTVNLVFRLNYTDKNFTDVTVILSDQRVDQTNNDLAYVYQPGKHYKYNVTISDNEMSLDVQIVKWFEDIIELK